VLSIPINIIGCTCGLYLTLVFYGNCHDESVRTNIERGMVFSSIMPVTLATAMVFGVDNADTRGFVFGVCCNVACISFFGSPLSTLLTIIRTRDASSLFWPMGVMTVCNGTAWVIYGVWIENK
jgi:solute carrier family 50 (sugar transporter)